MDLVRSILGDFSELGFVEISNGEVVQSIRPIFNVYTFNVTSIAFPYRWNLTLQYLSDYARYHSDFEGYYFLSVYDGWREYSEPIEPANRIYVPWQEIPDSEKGSHFRFGDVGEPRFVANPENVSLYIELPYPILAYNRHIGDRGVLLIPDSQFLNNTFQPYRDDVDLHDIPYNNKKSSMIWRGAANINSGYEYVVQPVQELLLEQRAHPRVLAESLSVVGYELTPSIGDIFNVSFDFLSVKELLRYKYLLDIDGMVSAWSAFYWKMYSNSAVIKCPSHWEQWYYQDLIPYEHYIPLRSFHPSDIYAVYAFCEQQTEKCEEIGRKGSEHVRRLTYQYAVEEYVIH